MVFRYESPVTGIQGVVAVIAHHKVVVLLERVLSSGFSVDDNVAILDLQGIVLIVTDDALIEGQVVRADGNGDTFLRDPQRAEEVAGPAGLSGEGEDAGILSGGGVVIQVGVTSTTVLSSFTFSSISAVSGIVG